MKCRVFESFVGRLVTLADHSAARFVYFLLRSNNLLLKLPRARRQQQSATATRVPSVFHPPWLRAPAASRGGGALSHQLSRQQAKMSSIHSFFKRKADGGGGGGGGGVADGAAGPGDDPAAKAPRRGGVRWRGMHESLLVREDGKCEPR